MPLNLLLWLIAIIFLFPTSLLNAQVNKSSKENYKQRLGKNESAYVTQYDNGYVILRDGTELRGEISLSGDSYDKVYRVKIRTTGGEKYVLYRRSLKEYGLSNSLVNDTPDAFEWLTINEKSVFTGFQDVRSASTSFGYVNTKDGKKYEGSMSLKEANGRIENIVVKDDKKKTTKIDAEEITNFGVKNYADPKFNGVWSLISWKIPAATGMMVNIKSVPLKGVVTLNTGEQVKGEITLVKKAEIINRIDVRDGPKGKPQKFKYSEVKSYGAEQFVSDYMAILKNGSIPYEQIPPARKFHKGKVLLVDGTVMEGLVAKSMDRDFTDIFYASDESSIVQSFSAAEVEVAIQDISEKTMADYKKLIYERDHINGYTIQRPPKWIYKFQNAESEGSFGNVSVTESSSSETEFQPGYLILADGTKKVGALSVNTINGVNKFTLKVGENKEKYNQKQVRDYGLIIAEAKTIFPKNWFNPQFWLSKKRIGFIVLTGSNEFITGPMKIKSVVDEETGNVRTDFIVDGNKYNIANIDLYGIMDVAAEDLIGEGVLIYSDPKQNFNPGSFEINGSKKEGWIAWYRPNDAGEYDAFFFSEEQNGIANVYYQSRGASNVVQNIEEVIEEYDPLEDSFLATKTIDKEVKNNGYVITANDEKLEGAVQLSFPPKLWFATDVTLTKTDGTVLNYTNDGALKKVVVNLDGVEKEFVNFENEYVEVLQRDGDLLHFRNPHPTTPTFTSDLANQIVGAGLNELNKELTTAALLSGAELTEPVLTKNGEVVDFTEVENFTLYEKEFIVFDEVNNRYAMYIPKKYFNQIENELMGCIEFLIMEKDEKNGLRKMQRPLQTMKFINENMNN